MTPGKFRFAACVLATLILPLPALAKVQPFPSGFRTQAIETGGATIHTRVGGEGPAVVLLHGFADTGDMWAPLAAELSRDHTVIVPDLRGMGLSSHPETGYEKKNQARDIAKGVKLNELVSQMDAAQPPVAPTPNPLLTDPGDTARSKTVPAKKP